MFDDGTKWIEIYRVTNFLCNMLMHDVMWDDLLLLLLLYFYCCDFILQKIIKIYYTFLCEYLLYKRGSKVMAV